MSTHDLVVGHREDDALDELALVIERSVDSYISAISRVLVARVAEFVQLVFRHGRDGGLRSGPRRPRLPQPRSGSISPALARSGDSSGSVDSAASVGRFGPTGSSTATTGSPSVVVGRCRVDRVALRSLPATSSVSSTSFGLGLSSSFLEHPFALSSRTHHCADSGRLSLPGIRIPTRFARPPATTSSTDPLRRRCASGNANFLLPLEPPGLEFFCRLYVVGVAARISAELPQTPCVCAVPPADDQHDVDASRHLERALLSVEGRLADRVEHLELAGPSSRP